MTPPSPHYQTKERAQFYPLSLLQQPKHIAPLIPADLMLSNKKQYLLA
jgi:hypothetical protein